MAPSRMHLELFGLLQKATQIRDARIAVAAPRGHAKTTVTSLAYVLWSVLYGHERFVLLVSATREQAIQLLADLKRELEQNVLLSSDFPEVCAPVQRRGITLWKGHHVVLTNGACVRVLGAGQALRGMKHGAYRPSLIIGDDLEELEATLSPEQRAKLLAWFEKTLLKSGAAGTNVVIVGTLLHYDSLLAGLVKPSVFSGRSKRSGWTTHVYQAVESPSDHPELWERWEAIRSGTEGATGASASADADEFFELHETEMLQGTKVLWPEREDYRRLMAMRADEGRSAFQSEKQNEPLDPDQCLFREQDFHFWDEEYAGGNELIQAVGPNGRLVVACDPSLGKRPGRGDYTAIITLLKDMATEVMYVVGADLRRCKPDELVQRLVRELGTYRVSRLGVEANQFQDVLVSQIEIAVRRVGQSVRVERLTTTTNKQARIESLEPIIRQGRLRFSRRHQLLLDQLRQFPLGAHDDGPDALDMAVSLLSQQPAQCRQIKLSGF
ncbi:MAG: phage terminase large subunit [Planctomycetota bacterium]